MRKFITTLTLTLLSAGLCGCEQFDRFEAWKKEVLFGEPNPYNMPQAYPYAYPPQAVNGQPVTGPVIQLQPGQPLPPGYAIVQPQPQPTVAAPAAPAASITPAGPQTLLPPSN